MPLAGFGPHSGLFCGSARRSDRSCWAQQAGARCGPMRRGLRSATGWGRWSQPDKQIAAYPRCSTDAGSATRLRLADDLVQPFDDLG